jgi:hypothetical protein
MGTLIVSEIKHNSDELEVGINGSFERKSCEDASWGLESV